VSEWVGSIESQALTSRLQDLTLVVLMIIVIIAGFVTAWARRKKRDQQRK
jgi:hypothetical protein